MHGTWSRSWLLALIVFPLLSTAAFSQATERVGVHVNQWWPEIDGHIRGSTDGVDGSNMDVRDDLNLLRENGGITEIGLWVAMPPLPFKFAFSTYGGAFNDGAILETPVVFEGTTIPAGTAVASEIILRAYTFMFEFGGGTPTIYQTTFDFAFQVGFQYLSHDFEIQSGTGFVGNQGIESVIPLLGIKVSVRLGGLFEVYGLLQAIQTFGLTDFDGHYIDATVELRWWAMPSFAFGVGYRYLQFFGETGNNDAFNIEIQGIFLGLVVKF